MSQPNAETPDVDPRVERVAQAVKTWQRHLVDLGGRNTLLWYRDLPTGTLDLTTAHPGGSRHAARRPPHPAVRPRPRARRPRGGPPPGARDPVQDPRARGGARHRRRLHRHRHGDVDRAARRPRSPAAPVLLRSCVLARPAPPRTTSSSTSAPRSSSTRCSALPPLGAGHRPRRRTPSRTSPPRATASTPTRCMPRWPGVRAGARLRGDPPARRRHVLLRQAADGGRPRGCRATPSPTTTSSRRSRATDRAARGAAPTVPESLPDADPDARATSSSTPTPRSTQPSTPSAPASTSSSRALPAPASRRPSPTSSPRSRPRASAALRRREARRHRRRPQPARPARSRRPRARRLRRRDATSARSRAAVRRGRLDAAPRPTDPETDRTDRDARRPSRLASQKHVDALHAVREPVGRVRARGPGGPRRARGTRTPPPTCASASAARRSPARAAPRAVELGRRLRDAAGLGAWTPGRRRPVVRRPHPHRRRRVPRPRHHRPAQHERPRRRRPPAQPRCCSRDPMLPEANSLEDWGRRSRRSSSVRDTLEVFRPEVFDIPLERPRRRDRHARPSATRATSSWAGSTAGGSGGRPARCCGPGPPPADLHAALVDGAASSATPGVELAGARRPPRDPASTSTGRRRGYASLTADLDLARRAAAPARPAQAVTSRHPAARRCASGSPPWRRRPTGSRSARRSSAALDELRAAGCGRSSTTSPRRASRADDVTAELDFVWWTSLSRGPHRARPRATAPTTATQLRRVAARVRRRRPRPPGGQRRRGSAPAVGRNGCARCWPTTPSRRRWCAPRRARRAATGRCATCCRRRATTLTAVKPVLGDEPARRRLGCCPRAGGSTSSSSTRRPRSRRPRPSRPSPAPVRWSSPGTSASCRRRTSSPSAGRRADAGAPTDETLTEGFESVLDVLTAALPTRQPPWHYRSPRRAAHRLRQRSRCTTDVLTTFPGTAPSRRSASSRSTGQAVVQPGDEAIETTEAEVGRVVELVLEHARTRPQESLGVIALGIKHADRLEEALRQALRRRRRRRRLLRRGPPRALLRQEPRTRPG